MTSPTPNPLYPPDDARAPGTPRGPEPAPEVTDEDLHFDRYPNLYELVTPRIGVQYVLVLGNDVRRYQRVSKQGNQGRPEEWWDTIPNMPAITIEGPKGTADTVVLLGKGRPATGGSDLNGKRRFYVDAAIEEVTGLYVEGAPSELSNGKVTDEEVEAARAESRPKPPKKDATKGGVISPGAPPAKDA